MLSEGANLQKWNASYSFSIRFPFFLFFLLFCCAGLSPVSDLHRGRWWTLKNSRWRTSDVRETTFAAVWLCTVFRQLRGLSLNLWVFHSPLQHSEVFSSVQTNLWKCMVHNGRSAGMQTGNSFWINDVEWRGIIMNCHFVGLCCTGRENVGSINAALDTWAADLRPGQLQVPRFRHMKDVKAFWGEDSHIGFKVEYKRIPYN